MARWFGAREFAEFAFWLAVFSPLLMFLGAGGKSLQLSGALSGVGDNDYFAGRLYGALVALAVATVLLPAAPSSVLRESMFVMAAVWALKLSESIAEGIQVVHFRRGKVEWASFIQLARAVVFFGTLLSLSRFHDRLVVPIVGASAAAIAVALVCSRFKVLELGGSVGSLQALWGSASVSVAVSIITLMAASPRVVAGSLGKSEEFLAISAIFPIVSVVSLVTASALSVLLAGTQRLSSSAKSAYFKRSAWWSVCIGAALAAILVPLAFRFGHILVRVVYGLELAEPTIYALTALGACIATTQAILNGLLVATGKKKALLVSAAKAAVFSAGILAFLVLQTDSTIGVASTAVWCLFGVTHTLMCFLEIKRESAGENS